MTVELSNFSFPTSIVFGPGAIKTLPDIVKDLKMNNPLLVTDPGLRKTDAYAAVETVLKESHTAYTLSIHVHPNPVEDDVERSGTVFRDNGCDGIIGLGGGSALDTAKAVAVRVTHEGPLTSFEAQIGGYKKITGPLPPIITIPTTAGTGSEVGRAAVIAVPELGRKIIVFSPLLMPKKTIADPELTIGLPPTLTAWTGMDAFTHNLESLTAPIYHPLCDAIAVGGLEQVIAYLERAVKNGTDLEARGGMMMAAMMGAIAFQKDLGAAHSLAHPLSTEFGMQHGLANALCLPPVMRFNVEAAAKHYARLAGLFGLPVHDMPEIEAANAAVGAVENLNQRIGITQKLRDFGIPEDALPKLAKKAFADSCHLTNPRPCTEDILLQLYKEAWS